MIGDDLLRWYEEHQPRRLAVTRCPADKKRMLAAAFWCEDRLCLWDVGYRMAPAESRREEIALEVGVIWDAEDRSPTDEEMAEIEQQAELPGRFRQDARARTLLPTPRQLVSCRSCRTSYELDTAGLLAAAERGNGENVSPACRLTLANAVNERIRRSGAEQRHRSALD